MNITDMADYTSEKNAPAFVPVTKALTVLELGGLVAASRKSVATELIAFATRRIMNNPQDKAHLEALFAMARKAGYAEGYAQAKLEMLLGQTGQAKIVENGSETIETTDEPVSKPEKLDLFRSQAEKIEESEKYVTKITVAMARAIALDYLKNAAPKIVGPTEIIKNSKKALDVVLTFGTLKRAIEALVEAGEIEQVEPSRWRFKEPTTPKASVFRRV